MPTPLQTFLSYSHKDTDLRSEFESHLASLIEEGLITLWVDHKITAGSKWNINIEENLENADLILLLISSYFINSKFAYKKELTKALEVSESGEALVIPIILRPVAWEGLPFASLQILPSGGKPVTTWNDYHAGWLDVTQHLKKAVLQWQKRMVVEKPFPRHLTPFFTWDGDVERFHNFFHQNSQELKGIYLSGLQGKKREEAVSSKLNELTQETLKLRGVYNNRILFRSSRQLAFYSVHKQPTKSIDTDPKPVESFLKRSKRWWKTREKYNEVLNYLLGDMIKNDPVKQDFPQ